MRSALILALAIGALAWPQKRSLVVETATHTDVVVAVSTVTVGASPSPPPDAPAADSEQAGHHWSNEAVGRGPPWGQGWSASSSSSAVPVVVPTSAPPSPSPSPDPNPNPSPGPNPTVAMTSSSSTSQAPSATAQPAKPTSYAEIAIYHHNLHRNNHSAPDIAWDDGLAATAATVASTCSFGHLLSVGGGGYGQTIAAGVEPTNISHIITEMFYNGEVGWYDGPYNQDNPDMTNVAHWGHFSQVVWVGSTHVGCATQYCPGKDGLKNVGTGVLPYFTVCNYKDPGNFAGKYGKNVLQSKGQPTVHWDAGL